jgi:hypothetical protein
MLESKGVTIFNPLKPIKYRDNIQYFTGSNSLVPITHSFRITNNIENLTIKTHNIGWRMTNGSASAFLPASTVGLSLLQSASRIQNTTILNFR